MKSQNKIKHLNPTTNTNDFAEICLKIYLVP